ncbi:MAG: PKD domain-containing protein [Planctomycetes bacterium]|nr:PKD domain-containing protein [Planctomycetota bacterium]
MISALERKAATTCSRIVLRSLAALTAALACSCGGGGGGASGSGGLGGDPGGDPAGPDDVPSGENRPPIAQASADVTSGDAPLTVTFSSAGTADPEGGLASFLWDFGDASDPVAAEGATHTYAEPGRYIALLTVADLQGLSGTSEVIVQVETQECPSFAPGVSQGSVESSSIVEASGIVASRRWTGVLWVNNDSGDSARLFAMTAQGKHLGVYNVQGAAAYDWEDLSIGPGPEDGTDYLFAADIGDNARARGYVTVYRVPEPSVSAAQAPGTFTLSGTVRLDMSYPDGAWDAEALFVDPLSGDIFIVSKRSDGRSEVYRNPAPHAPGARAAMQVVATLALGTTALPGSTLVTAGDMSPQGSWVILRTYSHAFLWRRPSGGSVADAFATEVCRVPARSEPQGEAICFAADGSGYFTVSEGSHPPLYFFGRAVEP